MASIFLSYAREDAARAKTLAKALERAGHSVWWDRHIGGGTEFSGEIEAALSSADIVLVLWSDAAVRSAWVRDEAAEGRDSDRLLPIQLDETPAPLGFRQLQAISLAGWSGRGSPPHLQDILQAIDKRSGKAKAPPGKSPAAPLVRHRLAVALGILAALLLALGAWWLLKARGEGAGEPVLAVLPFSDLSPDRDKAYFAEGVAEAILTVLAKEPGITVLGRSTARQLHEAGGNAGKMRKALGVSHVLEGSARSIGDQLRMSVRLVDAQDGQQLWAEEYRRKLDNVFAVQDEIGRAVAQRLKGSFKADSSPPAQQLTTSDAYTLYLAARAKMRDRQLPALKEALAMARKAIAADPNYAPGHALYAELVWHMSVDNYGTLSLDRARELATPHARRAIQLDPNASEGHAALGVVSTGEAAVASLTKAISLDPSRSELRMWVARRLELLGRNDEGLRQLEAATEMDPLFGPAMWNHAWWLAASKRADEAERVVADYERRGGSPAVAARVRCEIAGFYGGDYSEGVRLCELALKLDPQTPLARDNLTFLYDRLGLRQDATRLAGNLPPYTRLLFAGRHRQLDEIAQDDGAKAWEQPDSWAAIAALRIDRNWAGIERLFDLHPAPERLCGGSVWEMQPTFTMAIALKARGRTRESNTLLKCIKDVVARHARSNVQSQAAPAAILDLATANIHALEGRPEPAFAILERAISRGARATYGFGMSEYSAFDPYRNSPRYQALDSRLKQLIARDRAEVLRMRQSRRRTA